MRTGRPIPCRPVFVFQADVMSEATQDPYEMQNLFGKSEVVQKELTDMIRSRPDDAVPRLPQVGMA